MLSVDRALIIHPYPLQFPDFDEQVELGATATTFSCEVWFQTSSSEAQFLLSGSNFRISVPTLGVNGTSHVT
jgi:hypothetical protein